MKIPYLRSLSSIIIVCGLISGCADGKKVRMLRTELESEVRDLRSVQAEHTASLNQIRSEMRQISGQIEELQYLSQGKARELEKTIQQLGSRVPPPPGVPEDLLSADQERIAQVSGDAADTFRTALNQMRSGDFEGAKSNLDNFILANPGTAFTDNALFWLGIAHMKSGQYDRAIVSLSDVFQTYPAEDMVAPSLFFLSEVFEKSRSNEDAMLTLEKLIDEHPKSVYAAKAKAKLRNLKKRR
jgi:TolA-binding protein